MQNFIRKFVSLFTTEASTMFVNDINVSMSILVNLLRAIEKINSSPGKYFVYIAHCLRLCTGKFAEGFSDTQSDNLTAHFELNW